MKSALKRADFAAAIIRQIGTVLLAIFGLGALSTEAHAQFATGGTGLHRNSIFWVSWGNAGENVFAGRTITRNFYVGSPIPENLLAVTCTLSNAVAVQGASALNVYTPGNWQGDGLDDLYNIGGNHPGTGVNPNTLRSGLATASGATVEFDFSCSATLGGDPFPLRGLVFADAEASGGSEFVAAELISGGVIRIIDQISQCGSASTVTVNGSEVRLGGPTSPQVSCENNANPGLRAGPALVGFIDGATSARVIARGGGVSAVAVGAVLDVEFSEALPSSFGTAASHILEPVWNGGVATSGVNYNNPANLATRDPGIRLGATVASDQGTEPIGGSDVDALPKTTGAQGAGYADVLPPSGIPGSSYQISNVACVGPGNVAGWIDFDGNGAFDADERSNTASCPSGSGNVALSWTLPADFVAQATSYMRLRIAAPSDALPQATGLAVDGEAEDYRIDLVPARLTLVKTVVNDDGRTAVPADFVLHATGPSTVSGASGSSQVTNAAVNAGSYVLSEDNLPGYTASQFSCVVNGGAAVIGNALALAEGDAAVCTITNDDTASPDISVEKTANPAAGATVVAGQTITYTLTVTVANAATSQPVTLTDTLGAGLSFGAVTNAGSFICSGALNCELPAGTSPGSYALTYGATVDADATGTVGNSVVATNPPGGDPDPVCATCTTEHVVTPVQLSVAKSANPAPGTPVVPGSSIAYTLAVNVTNSATTEALTLTDTLGQGLTFGSVTNAGAFSCTGALSCVLPAGTVPGTYQLTYVATVDAGATGTVGNGVAATNPPGGDPDPVCATCTTEHPILDAAISVAKSSDPATGANVAPGDNINYTLTVAVTNSATTQPLTLTDTLGQGLSFGAVTNAGVFSCAGSLSCTLPAGTLPGSYALTYATRVDADATGTIRNGVTATNPAGGDPDPICTTCTTEHQVLPAAVTVSKTSDPASGTAVTPGDTISYTLAVTVANAATTQPLTLTDTLGEGLSFGAVTNAGVFTCSGSLSCTLAAGTLPGTYQLVYTATVDADATATVGNIVTATNPPGGDPDPACVSCTTGHPIVAAAVSVAKSANPASGATVAPGDTISYTLAVTVANSATTEPVTLIDTLGQGLSFEAVTDAGGFACSGSLSCTLPAGTLPGAYQLTYTARVDAGATGVLANRVAATNPPGGDPDPVCTNCATEHRVLEAQVRVGKAADIADGAEVRAGQEIAYRLTVTVENSATTEPVALIDTLGQGLSFGAVTNAGVFTCSGSLSCTLPAGTLPGSYELAYTATVDADAAGTVRNTVAATNPPGGDPDPICGDCTVEHRLMAARIVLAKTSNPGAGAEVHVGDTLEYSLTVTVENAATTQPITLTDTPDAGLTIGALPQGCTINGTISCVLPAGAVPGSYTFAYPATVNADASADVGNAVVGAYPVGGSSVECANCATSHKLADAASLRIVKSTTTRDVKVGDLVRYTLTVENVGLVNVADAIVVDTPPAGFSYVADSMSVVDRDGAFTLGGNHPLRIGGIDILAGSKATIVYLLRVGAGVRSGTHVNEAVAQGTDGTILSNVATAQVTLESDPLIEDSLIFGTVFDDRDGDGWQDSAQLSGVRVQGGFASSAYVAGSTTLDRGSGPKPVADASAPLLHGLDLGVIAGGEQLVIRQRLSRPDVTGDLVLTSAQGITLGMDMAGAVRAEQASETAKGLTAAQPVIVRKLEPVDGGWELVYTIANQGVDERGIAGVRIASVEGLLVETDQFGRYHLVDIPGGGDRGRNFILKVDPATLPGGSRFTTRNPLVRRITPGIPVRFDFGVRLPSDVLSDDPPAPTAAGRE